MDETTNIWNARGWSKKTRKALRAINAALPLKGDGRKSPAEAAAPAVVAPRQVLEGDQWRSEMPK